MDGRPGSGPLAVVHVLRDADGAICFPLSTLPRLARAIRLHRDLGIGFTGLGLVMDLLEQIEVLEAELRQLRPARDT